MNCVEFRRQLAVDPQTAVVAFVQHRAECPGCADAAARALAFEHDLACVLRVAPPPRLAETILLAQATSERRKRASLRRYSVLAAAAMLALAIGVVGMRAEAEPLSAQVVAHYEGEPEALRAAEPVEPAHVVQTFAARGVVLKHVPDGIDFAEPCPIGTHRSVHVVMPTTDGAVTVFYIADVAASRVEDFARDGLLGRSLPVAGGTLILLAKTRSQFDRIGGLWTAAIAG
ncbi:MAG: DUF3379 family protein [Proteobacteria bacterium]|nr:DUF3379 family protein [Pseudomonadota bacterium]